MGEPGIPFVPQRIPLPWPPVLGSTEKRNFVRKREREREGEREKEREEPRADLLIPSATSGTRHGCRSTAPNATSGARHGRRSACACTNGVRLGRRSYPLIPRFAYRPRLYKGERESRVWSRQLRTMELTRRCEDEGPRCGQWKRACARVWASNPTESKLAVREL